MDINQNALKIFEKLLSVTNNFEKRQHHTELTHTFPNAYFSISKLIF